MPRSQSRNSYGVLTLTVCLLGAIGALTRIAQPKLPQNPENALAHEVGDYYVSGSRQRIDWQPFSPQIFVDAKKRNLPVMLVLGAIWSTPAREAEQKIFSDSEVATNLRGTMICTRVDLMEQPQFMSAFEPLEFRKQISDPGFQILFLDPQGRLIDQVDGIGVSFELNASGFQEILFSMIERFRRLRQGAIVDDALGRTQYENLNAFLRSAAGARPQFSSADKEIANSGNPELGGFVRNDASYLFPQAIRYLNESGRIKNSEELTVPILLSRHVDWMDGGFFRAIRIGGNRRTEFDKLAQESADMALIQLLVDPAHPLRQRIAKDAFYSLTGEFLVNDCAVYARVGDSAPNRRSARSSFPVQFLRDQFQPQERDWMRNNFDLRVETNPVMSIRITSPEVITMPECDALLDKARTIKTPKKLFAGQNTCNSAAYVLARAIKLARFLNLESERTRLDSLRLSLEKFVTGEDLLHTLDTGRRRDPYLPDYLAMADMCMEWYIWTGDEASLERGARFLDRAIFIFKAETPGLLKTVLSDDSHLGIQNLVPYEIADAVRESCPSQFIRLAHTYSLLARNIPERSLRFAQETQSTMEQYSEVSARKPLDAAGYFASAMMVTKSLSIFCVGQSKAMMSQLQNQFPSELVLPVGKGVREDLRAKGPGIYIENQGEVSGPFSVEQAILVFGEARRSKLESILSLP